MDDFTYVLMFTLVFRHIECVGDERNVEVYTRNLNFANLNIIFNALKTYGPTKRPADQRGASQYTCTTVLSEEDVNDISWLRNGETAEFPDNFKTNDRRIRVQYNENNNKDHGEKIVLERYLGGLIAEMQTDSKEKGHNTYPVVLMYSFYIPCSMVQHTCARRLADDLKTRPTKYSLVVGYSEYYIYQQRHKNPKSLTINNIRESFKTLREGSVEVFGMIQDFSNQISFLVLQDDFTEIFQANLYECLKKQPLAYCCSAHLDMTADEAVDVVLKIVTFSINSMIYSCKEHLSNTGFLVKKLYPCFGKWIDSNIGHECQTCAGGTYGREVLIDYTNECVRQAWAYSDSVGALDNPYRLDYPSWKRGPISWPVKPADFPKNNPIYCYNRSLRPDSFCTKTYSLLANR